MRALGLLLRAWNDWASSNRAIHLANSLADSLHSKRFAWFRAQSTVIDSANSCNPAVTGRLHDARTKQA